MGYPTQQQKVDYLFKKIGFTKTKTGVAEDQTSGFSGDTKKAPPNEAIASPLVIPTGSVWSDSSFIPTTPPTSNTAYVGVYTTATAYRMTVDTTVANERTFIARQTWGNPSSAIEGDWIDTQFGANYLVKVYMGDPSTGVPGVAYTNLSAAGTSGKDDVWFFDYSSGVLNFNGADLDGQLVGIHTDNVYLVGYRYIGRKGIQPPAGIGTFHDLVVSNNLSVSGISTFTGLVDANGGVTANTLIVEDLTNNRVVIAGTGGEIEDDANLTFDGAGLVVGANLNVTGVSTFGGIIEATAGENKIPSLYLNYSDLPNPSTYHGMFAHVHGTQKGYFAHAGGWYELVNKETTGVVGTGTETYHIGDLNVTGITTLGSIGISTGRITGPAITYIDPATVGDDTGTLVVKGNLQVEGTQTTVNSSTMTVTDKNIELAKGAANDAAADGGGITVESGDGDKTWQWVDATDSWTSSEHIRIPDDKVFGFTTDTNTYIGRPAADTIAFTHGGGEKVRITSDGEVGIGTTNPQEKLHISDTGNPKILIEDTDSSNQVGVRFKTPTQDWIAGLHGGVGFFKISKHSAFGSNDYFTINGSGNVGINSVIPTAKLDVIGDTKLQGNVSVGGATTISDDLNVTASLDVGIDLDVDGRSELDIVNISETLSVSGISTFSKEVGISSALNVAGVSTFTGNIDANGDLDVDGQTNLDDVSIAGVTTAIGNIIIQNTYPSLFFFDADHNDDFSLQNQNGVFAVRDETNNENRLTINSSGIATFTNNLNVNENLNVTGDVGIGSTQPQAKLDINGSLHVSGISTFQDDVTLTTASGNNIVFDKSDNALKFGNDVEARFGLFQQFRIKQNGTSGNSEIIHNRPQTLVLHSDKIDLRPYTNGSNVYLRAIYNSSIDLYYANSVKFATSGIGATVFGQLDTTDIKATGITTTGTLNTGDTTFTGTISAGSTTGTDGYYLKSVGTGVTWAAFPTVRTGLTTTATAGQTTFNFSYNIGYVDVFLNGVKLPESEFTATNGSTIVLDDAAFVNDTLEFISLNTTPGSSSGAQVLDQLNDVTITGTPVIGETLQHNGSEFVNDYTATATTTSTSQTAILSLPVATYRSAEYTIQVTEGTKYHVTKVLAIHDGTNVTFNEYGTLTTSTPLSTFALDVNSGNMRLLATPASTNSTVFKVKFTGIKV